MAVVVLTRESRDNEPLAGKLSAAGLTVINYPCVKTGFMPVAGLLADYPPTSFEAYALTSRRAVTALAGLAAELAAAPVRLVAVGPGTATAIQESFGRPAQLIADDGTGAGLARALREILVPGDNVLHLRGDKTTGTLKAGLEMAGIHLQEVVVYENLAPDLVPLACPEGSLVVFASPSAARRFVGANPNLVPITQGIAIGPTTYNALSSLGWADIATARQPDLDGLYETIMAATEDTHR
jgi:uroporphyrinogen-III synthase